MRLAGQSKLGYYPTPQEQTDLISSCLKSESEDKTFIRLLDPCCGEGTALASIGKKLGTIKTFGVELSDVRYEVAKQILYKTLLSPFEHTIMTNGTFSLVLLNPPYDGETMTGGGTRLEELFLKLTIPLLSQNGILIYIIPQTRVTPNVGKMLAGWFDNLSVFKFAGDGFEDFNQLIIFGRKKEYKNPTEKAVEEICYWSNLETVISWTEDKEPKPNTLPIVDISNEAVSYSVIPAPERGECRQVFRFKFQPISGEDYMRMGKGAMEKLSKTKAWLDFAPPLEKKPIEPAISPNQGHIGMQVTGNLLGTVKIVHDNKPMLLKGSLLKVSSKIEQDDVDQVEGTESGSGGSEKHRNMKKIEVKERFEPVITTMSQDGIGEMVTDPNDVTELLKKHINELVQIVQDRNVPLYRYDPTDEEWTKVSALSKERAWPGQPAGFSEQQKHVIVAGTRVLKKGHNAVLPIIEMGGGKTGIGAALVEMLDSYPAFVVAPGMVTSESANWNEEIPQIISDAKIKTIYISAHPLPKPLKIIDWLRYKSKDIDIDTKSLDGADASTVYGAIQIAISKLDKFMTPEISKALRVSLRFAELNPPGKVKGSDKPNLLNGRIGGYLWLDAPMIFDEKSKEEILSKYSLAQFINEYKSRILPRKSFAITSYETAKLGSGRQPAYARRVWGTEQWDRNVGEYKKHYKVVPACPKCGQPIADEYRTYDDRFFGKPQENKIIELDKMEAWTARTTRFCQAPKPRRVWFPDEKWQDDLLQEHIGRHKDIKYDPMTNVPYVCGAALFSNTTYHRYPAASFVKKKANGFFKTVLFDELHKAKSEDTGVGHVMATLSGITKYTIGLTGTLFGGYSSSIFPILYRVLPAVKATYDHGDRLKWAGDMGLIKHSYYVYKNAQVGESGTYTGRKNYERVDELPGISPNIAKYILPICIFQSLTEMGLPLPDYNEEVVRIPMTDEMRKQYDEMDGHLTNSGLFKWAVDEKKRPDGTGKGAIGVWFNACFNRPNAMFRAEEITFNRRIGGFGQGKWAERNLETVWTVPKVYDDDRLLPKEEWLFNTVKAQHLQGRKSIVYIRQTGSRDIQEHIAEILKKTGLRISILSPSIAVNKRIDWLKKNASKFDVLLTNPRLIEVGLNLTMLPTAIFYEIDASFYTLYQAMKRVYRPFAPKPVQIYFAVYEDTAEDTIFNVMGEKFLSNQLLTGQEIGGALVPDDAGSVLQVAIYRTMNKIEIKKATGLFGVQNKGTTASPVGSVTAVSPILSMGSMEEWLKSHGFETTRMAFKAKHRKIKAVSSDQLVFALFNMVSPTIGEETEKADD